MMNNFKKTCGYPYILCYEIEVASLFNKCLVYGGEQKVGRLYFSRTRGMEGDLGQNSEMDCSLGEIGRTSR